MDSHWQWSGRHVGGRSGFNFWRKQQHRGRKLASWEGEWFFGEKVRLEPIFPLPNNEQIEILCLVAHVSFEYDFSSCSECRFTHRLWYLCLELPRLQKQGYLIFSYILSYTYSYTRTYIYCPEVFVVQKYLFHKIWTSDYQFTTSQNYEGICKTILRSLKKDR